MRVNERLKAMLARCISIFLLTSVLLPLVDEMNRQSNQKVTSPHRRSPLKTYPGRVWGIPWNFRTGGLVRGLIPKPSNARLENRVFFEFTSEEEKEAFVAF